MTFASARFEPTPLGSRFIEVANVLGEDREYLSLTQDDHLIKALALHATEEAFAGHVHVRRVHRGLDHSNPEGTSSAVEVRAELVIPVANKESRSLAKGRGIPESLRGPRGRGRARDGHVHDLARSEIDDEKGECRPGTDTVRVQKKGGATTRTYFDGFYYRTDDGSHPVHVFLIDNGARIVAEVVRTETDSGLEEKTYFLHDDVLGSIKVVSNAAGQPVQQQRFGAFGPIRTTGDPTSIFGYTGHEEEAELGLVNMRARMYDPVIGRFLQPDPIMSLGDSQQSNPYAYVLNNPLRYTDPFGLANCEGCSGTGSQTIIGSLLGSGGPNEHGLLAAARLTVIQAPSNGSSSIQAHAGLTFDQKLNFALWGMATSGGRFGQGGTGSLLPSWIPTAGSTWAPPSNFLGDQALNDTLRGMCAAGLGTCDEDAGTFRLKLAILPAAGEFAAAFNWLSRVLGLGGEAGEAAGGLTAAEKATADLAGKLKFTETAAKHMAEAGRYVPRLTLAAAIQQGARMADPQRAAGAIKIAQDLVVNGTPRTLEIIYREADNMILHFLYK